jgi:hypothetical protein
MPLIERAGALDETRHSLLWPVGSDRIAHLPTPTPEPDDEDDEDDDKDRGSGGGNIDPDDDDGGSGDDDDDDEDDTLWARRSRAASDQSLTADCRLS